MINVGDMVGGRYRLERQIGEGGMASVWLAYDGTLLRNVAIKFVWHHDPRRMQAVASSFLREARLAASVVHRNVVQVLDFGLLEDHTPYMVMEALTGETLGDLFNDGAQFNLDEVVDIVTRCLEGLEAVHRAGIVHRDMKPENIFLVEEPSGYFPKLLDFGISRSLDSRGGRRSAVTTRDGRIIGTPEYMSPEQAAGTTAVDRRTDIYSIGVIIYETLVGDVPYKSEHIGQLIMQITRGGAPTVFELVPEVGPELSDVVQRAMAPNPNDRFADAAEMLDAFEKAAAAARNRNSRAAVLPERCPERRKRTFLEDNDPDDTEDPILLGLAHTRATIDEPHTGVTSPAPTAMPTVDQPVNSGVGGSRLALWSALGVASLAAVVVTLVLNQGSQKSSGNKFIVVQGNTATPELGTQVSSPAPSEPTPPTVNSSTATDKELLASRGPEMALAADQMVSTPQAQRSTTNASSSMTTRGASTHRSKRSPPTPAQAVARAFSRHKSQLVNCFDAKAQDAASELTVRVTIDEQGRVVDSAVAPSEYDGTPVGSCVRTVVGNMRFEPQESRSAYRVPLIARRGS